MPVRLCILWLAASVAVAGWPTAWGQPPGGSDGRWSLDRLLDPNKDGSVSKDELREFFRQFDSDKDGSVSKEELKEFFRRFDLDKDDTLSKQELNRAIASRSRGAAKEIDGPSVVEGQKAGIEVGQYAPDFELQPIEPYPKLREWLGRDAPVSIEQKVRLSQLVGKQPVLLLYGSYT